MSGPVRLRSKASRLVALPATRATEGEQLAPSGRLKVRRVRRRWGRRPGTNGWPSVAKVEDVYAEIKEKYGVAPTDAQLAERLGISRSTLWRVRSARAAIIETSSPPEVLPPVGDTQ